MGKGVWNRHSSIRGIIKRRNIDMVLRTVESARACGEITSIHQAMAFRSRLRSARRVFRFATHRPRFGMAEDGDQRQRFCRGRFSSRCNPRSRRRRARRTAIVLLADRHCTFELRRTRIERFALCTEINQAVRLSERCRILIKDPVAQFRP